MTTSNNEIPNFIQRHQKKLVMLGGALGLGITAFGLAQAMKSKEGESILPIENMAINILVSMGIIFAGFLLFGYMARKSQEVQDIPTNQESIKKSHPKLVDKTLSASSSVFPKNEFQRDNSSSLIVGQHPKSQPQNLKHESKSSLTKLVFFNPFWKSSESSDDIIGKCSEITYEDNLLVIGEEAIKNDEKPENPSFLQSTSFSALLPEPEPDSEEENPAQPQRSASFSST